MEKEKSELEERSHSARIQQGKRQSGNRCSQDKEVRCVHVDSMEEREKRIMALMGRERIMAFSLKDFVPRTVLMPVEKHQVSGTALSGFFIALNNERKLLSLNQY